MEFTKGKFWAPEGWNPVFIRTEIGEEYFEMVREEMEIMEDPKPELELVEKLIETKRKTNAERLRKSVVLKESIKY